MNIAQGLAHSIKVAGNRPAISCGEVEYTWRQFAYRTDCLARGLAYLGVQHGERVAVERNHHRRHARLGPRITHVPPDERPSAPPRPRHSPARSPIGGEDPSIPSWPPCC